jgi:hypothetical protein
VAQLVLILVISGLLFASWPIAAGYQWIQTDWQGGRTTPALQVGSWTDTYDNYYQGENENVLVAGEVKLENTVTPLANIATHVVISEVDAGNDWVELYNPTGSAIDIGGWTLDTSTYLDDATIPAGTTIQPYSFYSIGDAGTGADYTADAITVTLDDAWVQIQDAAGVTVDLVGWGGTAGSYEGTQYPNDLVTGITLERKAQATSTAASLAAGGADANLGNGYDTDNNANDFVEQSSPSLQTAASPAEEPVINVYKPAGWLESSIYDAVGIADWGVAVWNASIPTGTSLVVKLRTGGTENAYDGTWSAWYPHDNNTENTAMPDNRYVQYRVELYASTDNTLTPELYDITINYTLVNDFAISASPTSVTVIRGSSASTTVTVELTGTTPADVTLSGSWPYGAPAGVTATFEPDNGPASPTFTRTLTFTASPTATLENFIFRVTGQDGNLTRTFDFTLWVATFDFTLTASPDNLLMLRGETATSTIRVSLLAGDPATVELSGDWVDTAPTGVTATLSPTSGVPPFDSTLTVSVGTDAKGGSFLYRIVGSGGGKTSEIHVRIDVNVGLILTLATDKENYQKGETIRISGTAKDPRGENVENGTATIKLVYDNSVIQENSVSIENGIYAFDYPIWHGDPDGIWAVTVEAVDNLKNTATETVYITVRTPPGVAYYTVVIESPMGVITRTWGDLIEFSVRVTDDGVPVEGATVFFDAPTGERIYLSEVPGFPGYYTVAYTLRWDSKDDLGTWTVRINVEKIKSGGAVTGIIIREANLVVSLLSPKDRVEVGETAWIRVKVTYPDGTPVEDATLRVVTPAGVELTLEYEGNGIYSKAYKFTSRDVGTWNIQVGGEDLYGNTISLEGQIEVARMGILRTLTTYWWASLPILVALGGISAYLGRRTILVRKLKRVRKEIREIPKLKREVMIKYFKEGSIERDTYDELMDKYDMRLGELRKEEMRLSAKVGKKVKVKRAGRKRRR